MLKNYLLHLDLLTPINHIYYLMNNSIISETIQKELNLKEWQVNKIIELIDNGNTIPFIARYRKDVTGYVNDETLRKFENRLKYLRNLEEKKEKIIKRIDSSGKLNSDLENRITAAKTLVELEDLYRPFKSKKQTKASIAKDCGLEPLANIILEQNVKKSINQIAEKFINPKKGINSSKEAINGAKNIISEIISDNAVFRKKIRKKTFYTGKIETKVKNKEISKEYELYYDYNEDLRRIPPHRIHAINRAEKEKVIKVKITVETNDMIKYLSKHILINKSKNPAKIKYNKYTTPILIDTINDSYKRLIAPSIEREIRNFLTKKAEEKSMKVFTKNLNQLLMESPISNKIILGWDPAFKTGCKLAVIDETGKVLDTSLIYPTEPQNKIIESEKIVNNLIKKYNINIIAIGNGTASRESAKIVSNIIRDTDVDYVIVNEAGASVYSASSLGSEELPEYNEGERSAISIARRLQDPLAELVKIDPKSIGVGQYQHDMNQKKLNESLNGVVEKVVNEVGVDLNTASVSLLKYVSGITNTIARNIIEYRENNNGFNDRKELLKVKKLGDKTYKQCAGFVKISNPNYPLDNTMIHPESYEICEKLLNSLDYTIEDVGDINLNNINLNKISSDFDTGIETLKDIVNELKKPGRDPREDTCRPKLLKDVLDINDLRESMILEGTVRNIVDFGAFVDVGVHQDGLVHISQLSNSYVAHPSDIVCVGEIVRVKVLKIDIERKRIDLTMIL